MIPCTIIDASRVVVLRQARVICCVAGDAIPLHVRRETARRLRAPLPVTIQPRRRAVR